MEDELKSILDEVSLEFCRQLNLDNEHHYYRRGCNNYGVKGAVFPILTEILWEEDAMNMDLKACYFSNMVRVFGEFELELYDRSVETSEDEEQEGTSNEQLTPASGNCETSVVENFVNFTYWAVETGDRVSTTTNPNYAIGRGEKVTLLEESEAFVAQAFWGSSPQILKSTPRHLLLQVTQIASRAFFDPDYRSYLRSNYLK